jgi:hypothetical protein
MGGDADAKVTARTNEINAGAAWPPHFKRDDLQEDVNMIDKRTGKPIEHIASYEVAFNPELLERLAIEDRDEIDTEMSDYWFDCDYVKTHGEAGRGSVEFIIVETEDRKYVIYNGEPADDEDAEELVNWFLTGRPGEVEIDNTWAAWNDVEKGIAYRGGMGYAYALYAREVK